MKSERKQNINLFLCLDQTFYGPPDSFWHHLQSVKALTMNTGADGAGVWLATGTKGQRGRWCWDKEQPWRQRACACIFWTWAKMLLWWAGTWGTWTRKWGCRERLSKHILIKIYMEQQWGSSRDEAVQEKSEAHGPKCGGPSVNCVLLNYTAWKWRCTREEEFQHPSRCHLTWAVRVRPCICIQCTSPWAYLLPSLYLDNSLSAILKYLNVFARAKLDPPQIFASAHKLGLL